ncbi:RrF2 family transcriptional regulator [Chelatococcus asaccharovorans]|uniref:RrF2 family transcriptional regulator n=1 Tax=Chelatococcus asaccharovorans TaxID=28210 RepID=UPI00224C6DE2|nr:Rrf2 family transcriptional regulator [Chelatococcus asaccharovorans]CAH1661409.1 HTH-type transcriptional regulator NsrR [Chelatococcus asaccharovorans]CAH1689783.1 HTH-type transcriptional regulator NsrR [Chelatococcus asaccharovorans]
MRLTTHTDYALRVLMTLAVMEDGQLVTIEELADRHRISRNHLMKVAQTLVGLGLVKGVRGRRGGLALARSPEDIRMGTVVRMLETDMELVACLGGGPATCALAGLCRLTGAFRGAIEAFFDELDRLTLADLVFNRAGVRGRLAMAS